MKKFVSFLCAGAMLLSLAACGSTGDNGDSGDGGSGGSTGVTPTRIDGMIKEDFDDTDYSAYLGIWDGVVEDWEDAQKLFVELNEDGEPRWQLFVAGDLTYEGFLQIRPQYENYVYACNEYDGCGYMCWFDSYDVLHIEFNLDGNSCIFVPEGTVPGWAAEAE